MARTWAKQKVPATDLMLKGKLTLRVMDLLWSMFRLFSFTLRSFSSRCLNSVVLEPGYLDRSQTPADEADLRCQILFTRYLVSRYLASGQILFTRLVCRYLASGNFPLQPGWRLSQTVWTGCMDTDDYFVDQEIFTKTVINWRFFLYL